MPLPSNILPAIDKHPTKVEAWDILVKRNEPPEYAMNRMKGTDL